MWLLLAIGDLHANNIRREYNDRKKENSSWLVESLQKRNIAPNHICTRKQLPKSEAQMTSSVNLKISEMMQKIYRKSTQVWVAVPPSLTSPSLAIGQLGLEMPV